MADETPPYNEVQNDLLDPKPVFHADQFRSLYLSRNIAFAREILAVITGRVNTTDPPELKNGEGRGWNYTAEGKLKWDEVIGYPAYQAFTTDQVFEIRGLAERDLRERGFKIGKLDLVRANRTFDGKSCTKIAGVECKCQCHGIFVKWWLIL